ncbi:MAG: ankyrin repeat domain-containing protein [Odoribacter sp.]|nr:ankyrin repeat domain-containing protein [Odoribacter sp.]
MTETRGASQIQYEIKRAYESYKDKEEILELYKNVENLEETNPAQNEQTYLHLAAYYAHPEAIEYLLEQGLKPNDTDRHGYTPLQCLAQSTHQLKFEKRDPEDIDKCVDLLLKARASVLLKDTGGGEKLCYQRAVECENFRFVYALMRNKAKLNMLDRKGQDIFYYILCYPARSAKDRLKYAKDEASIKKQEDILEKCFELTQALLDYGLDPDKAADKAIELKLDKLALLLKGEYDELDENLQDKILAGGKNLHQACQESNVEAVKALIRLGADINEVYTEPHRTFKDKTPLAIAAIYASPECVEALLEAGVDPNFRGGEKRV